MTNTYCCEYSIKTPDDGQSICQKHIEFFTKIILRNNNVVGFYYKNILKTVLAGRTVDKVPRDHIFLRVLRFIPASYITPVFSFHLYITVAT